MRGGTEQAQEPALTGLVWAPPRPIEKTEDARQAPSSPEPPGVFWRVGTRRTVTELRAGTRWQRPARAEHAEGPRTLPDMSGTALHAAPPAAL